MENNQNEVSNLNIQLDTSKIENKLAGLSIQIGKMKEEITRISDTINSTSNVVTEAVKTAGSGIVASLSTCVTASIVEAISNFQKAFEEKTKGETVSAFGDKAFDVMIVLLQESLKMTGKSDKSPPLLLPAPAGKSTSPEGISGSVNGITNSVAGVGGMIPDLQSITEMKEAMSDLISTIKESVVQWGRQTLAKAKDRAEDLKIIALNAVEHVKAFGLMIGQLIASAAAWVSETAAKVANTVATWASVVATTAWQGICIAATAVTTAFGAAMNFLTSPIGLVVLAVGALIAIVVLLVKNWDTVKAAALSVWEAIKEAFGNAWNWFKDTVLDPLVNGFKGMVNGIIGFLNGLIAGIVKGINSVIGLLNKLKFDIPDWVPGLGGQTFGFNIKPLNAPQIPLLAQGAVLPANKPFLAVVGDQKHGTNVEAPLDTIKQAVAEVLAGQGNGDVVINFTGDLAQLARVLKPVIDRENRRVGVSLAKGVV